MTAFKASEKEIPKDMIEKVKKIYWKLEEYYFKLNNEAKQKFADWEIGMTETPMRSPKTSEPRKAASPVILDGVLVFLTKESLTLSASQIIFLDEI